MGVFNYILHNMLVFEFLGEDVISEVLIVATVPVLNKYFGWSITDRCSGLRHSGDLLCYSFKGPKK